jgi:hypothetical protein
MSDQSSSPTSVTIRSPSPSGPVSTPSDSSLTAHPSSLFGATGVQLKSNVDPSPAAPSNGGATSRVIGGPTTVTISGGHTTTETRNHVTKADSGNSSSDNGAPMYHSAMGGVRSAGSAKDSDYVTVNGITTTVAAARHIGLIAHDAAPGGSSEGGTPRSLSSSAGAQGAGVKFGVDNENPNSAFPTPSSKIVAKFREAMTSSDSDQRSNHRSQFEQIYGPGAAKTYAGQDGPSEPTIATLDERSETVMDDFVNKVDRSDIYQGLKNVLHGEAINEDLIARAGTKLGLDSAKVQEHVATLHAAFEKQATDEVGSRVLEWAKENRLSDLRQAAHDQVATGNLNGYVELSKEYLSKLPDIDPSAILNSPDAAARGIKRERNGTITLDIPGADRMEWRAAIRAGFIGPRFRKSR